jgi:hypothetical protein
MIPGYPPGFNGIAPKKIVYWQTSKNVSLCFIQTLKRIRILLIADTQYITYTAPVVCPPGELFGKHTIDFC